MKLKEHFANSEDIIQNVIRQLSKKCSMSVFKNCMNVENQICECKRQVLEFFSRQVLEICISVCKFIFITSGIFLFYLVYSLNGYIISIRNMWGKQVTYGKTLIAAINELIVFVWYCIWIVLFTHIKLQILYTHNLKINTDNQKSIKTSDSWLFILTSLLLKTNIKWCT